MDVNYLPDTFIPWSHHGIDSEVLPKLLRGERDSYFKTASYDCYKNVKKYVVAKQKKMEKKDTE